MGKAKSIGARCTGARGGMLACAVLVVFAASARTAQANQQNRAQPTAGPSSKVMGQVNFNLVTKDDRDAGVWVDEE